MPVPSRNFGWGCIPHARLPFESGASTNAATGAWGEDNSGGVCAVNVEMPLSEGRQRDAESLCAQLAPQALPAAGAGFGGFESIRGVVAGLGLATAPSLPSPHA